MEIKKDFIENDDIFEYYELNNKVYFSSIRDIQYSSFSNTNNKEYIKVPYIPRDSYGNVNIEELEKMKKISSLDINSLQDVLSNTEKDIKFKLEYRNISKALKLDRNIRNEKIKDLPSIISSDKLAIAKSNELDWSKCKYNNLTELLLERKYSKQEIIYYEKEGAERQTISELYNKAVIIAKGLRKKGIKKGDKLIFQVPNRKYFIEGFWACMIIGAIPAPLTELDNYTIENINFNKLYNIWSLLDKPYILTIDSLLPKIEKLKDKEKFSGVSIISLNDAEKVIDNTDIEFYSWNKEETSIILFTSGSTGIPKGVELTQKNIFARTLGEIQLYNLDNNNIDFNWMSLTHAAGIIWSHIRDVYMEILQIQVDTEIILNKPLLLLELMNEYKATIMWAPNFAFSLIADNIDEDKDYGWNLSHVKYMFAAGEANISRVLLRFLSLLKKYSLPKNSIIPSFGMTETSSCVTYYNNFTPDNHSDNDQFLPVGEPMPGCELRIVNDKGEICKEGEVGYLHAKGLSYTKGYYKNNKANEESFTKDGYLITGDLGYIVDNNLTLTGREKDIIIINGLNYYVQDLEAATDEVEGVLTSYSVATSVIGKGGTEEVLIFFTPEDKEKLKEEKINELKEIVENIRKKIQEKCLLNPSSILPFVLSEEARTDIGKKQRNVYRSDYLEGKYRIWEERLDSSSEFNLLTTKWIRNNIKESKDSFKLKYIFNNEEQKNFFLAKYNDITEESIINDVTCINDNDIIIDFTFYSSEFIESNDFNLSKYYYTLQKHMKFLASLDKKIKVYFITKEAIHIKNITKSINWNFTGSDVLTVCKTLSQENNLIDLSQIDFDEYSHELMKKEVNNRNKEQIIVYNEGLRYVQRFKTISNENNISMINKDDVILIVGGLGGIGFNLCKILIKEYNSKLVILGKSDLSKKIEKFKELKKLQEDIYYCQADITDYDSLQRAIKNVEESNSIKINGIINLAGTLSTTDGKTYNDNLMSHKLECEIYDNYYIPGTIKLLGTINLNKIKNERNLKYMIVVGSVTAYLGCIAFGAYAASNAMQEQYCNYLRNNNDNVYSILWSFWNETGMAKGINVNTYKQNVFQHINLEQGIECFKEVLKTNNSINIIGINRESMGIKYLVNDNYEPVINVLISDNSLKSDIQKSIKEQFSNIEKYINYKKDLSKEIKNNNNFMFIWNKLESIWKDVLKVTNVEVDDNIFDLGGDSISIYTISNKITDILNVSIKPIDIMTNPRISDLTTYILNKTSTGSNKTLNNSFKDKSNKRNNLRQRRYSRKEV